MIRGRNFKSFRSWEEVLKHIIAYGDVTEIEVLTNEHPRFWRYRVFWKA